MSVPSLESRRTGRNHQHSTTAARREHMSKPRRRASVGLCAARAPATIIGPITDDGAMPMLPISRRRFVTAVAAGAAAAAVPGVHAREAPSPKWRGYGRATVIDALGGPGSANKPGAALDA